MKRLAVGALAALALGGALFVPNAAAIDIPAQQWNTCSNSANTCWAEAGPNRLDQIGKASVAIYIALAANPRPWVVTLEEVCSETYVTVRDALVPQGYTPDRIITQTGVSNCGSFGNAMFTLGSVGPFKSLSLGVGRAIGCRVKGTYVGSMKFCVTHPLTSSQVNAAVMFYHSTAGGMGYDHRLIGADLNKTPSELSVFYSYDRELDYRNPPQNTHNTQRFSPKWKIDYLFIDMPSWRTPSRICEATWSDHCYLYGNFAV